MKYKITYKRMKLQKQKKK